MESAKSYVEKIYREIDESRDSRLWLDAVNMLSTVSESIFSRSAHFILELLQNAEDAGQSAVPPGGQIEFAISEKRIRITHNGIPFSKANVDAICGVRSTKRPEKGTLGFLGIGFKSVFKVTDCPQVHSGDFHFKFDKDAHSSHKKVPWQIMPLWIEHPSESMSSEQTTFVLPFRNTDSYEQTLSELKKLDVHVFMFLKWLNRLKVIDESNDREVLLENLGESDGIVCLSKNRTIQRFVFRRRRADVPQPIAKSPSLEFYKRQNVKQREVVVAFAVDDEGNLNAIEEASALGSVSSFLPLVEERSGAKFLIQADFLVQPGREAIQYEHVWNRWLLDETVALLKDVICEFKCHPRWGRQYLPIVNVDSLRGREEFDKLFGPHLRDPLIEYLQCNEILPTASGEYAKPSNTVEAEQGLEELLDDHDLPLFFSGERDLRLVSATFDDGSLPKEIRQFVKKISLEEVARKKALLEKKKSQPGFASWFKKLYEKMAATPGRDFRSRQTKDYRGRFTQVDAPILILTDGEELVFANEAQLRDIPQEVLELRRQHPEVENLLSTHKLVHPSLDTDELKKFFQERTHVREIDYERICRNVFLPKMRISAQAPPKEQIIAYSRLLQKGPKVSEAVWVVSNKGDRKHSNQLFFSSDFSPAEDWEKNAKFSPEIDFLSPEYVQDSRSDELPGWKQFFLSVGVKEKGEKHHVEEFAMKFVEEKLNNELYDFVAKNRDQVGYDREARRIKDGSLVKIEIKGQTKESVVELTPNESNAAKAARENGEAFWVCIVPGIPENPQLWVLEDAEKAGRHDKLTIDISRWRSHGRRVD